MSTSSNVPVTMTVQLLREFHGNSQEQNDITILYTAIQQACKTIASAIRTARMCYHLQLF